MQRLHTLVAVADAGSLAGAARRLHFSQPAVSQQIAALEAEIGAPLLVRLPRGVRLTPAGVALVDHARVGLQRLELGLRDARAVVRGELGEIRLAAFPTASAALLPPALAALRRAQPGLRVTVEELESEDSLPGLRDDEFDLVVAFSFGQVPVADDLTVVELGPDPLFVCLPLDHPLAARRTVDVAQLQSEPWIGGRSTGSMTMLVRLCAEAGFAPRPGPRTANYATAQGLVAAGLGVALVPGLALDYPRADVVARPVRTRPRRHLYLASARRAVPSAGTAALSVQLQRAMRARRARG